jgi:hypothetical protein
MLRQCGATGETDQKTPCNACMPRMWGALEASRAKIRWVSTQEDTDCLCVMCTVYRGLRAPLYTKAAIRPGKLYPDTHPDSGLPLRISGYYPPRRRSSDIVADGRPQPVP